MIRRNGQQVPGFGLGQVVVDGPSIVHTAVGIGVIVPPHRRRAGDQQSVALGGSDRGRGRDRRGDGGLLRAEAGENVIRFNGRGVRGFGLDQAESLNEWVQKQPLVAPNPNSPAPSYVPPHPTPVIVKALVAGAVGAVAGAGMSYADTRAVRGSAVSYGAVVGVIGALVAQAIK
jgi:hypothetical protein